MKKITLLLLLIVFTVKSFSTPVGPTWCGNSYMTVNSVWYTGSNSYVQPAGKFQGASLGSFGSTSTITLGGELQAYPVYSSAATLYYRIDTGSFVAISLPNTGTNGNNSVHSGSGSVSLSSLSAGSHTLEIYFQAGTTYDNNSAANYKATFTVSSSSVADPTACTASISSTTATLGWTKAGSLNVMVVKYAKNVTANAPTTGKTYAVNDTIGAGIGTVVYTGSGTSATPTVTANTDYDFYFYSVNSNSYSAGIKIAASRDKFEFRYGVDGGPSWTFLTLNQNANNPDQFEVNTTLPDITGLSCYVAWNSAGTGDPTWTNTSGGHSNTVLMSSISTMKSGQVWLVIAKTSTADNWGVSVPLNTSTIESNKNAMTISGLNGLIDAHFSGVAQVELFNSTGKLIRSVSATNQFTQSVKDGIYLLRINGQTHKVLVQ